MLHVPGGTQLRNEALSQQKLETELYYISRLERRAEFLREQRIPQIKASGKRTDEQIKFEELELKSLDWAISELRAASASKAKLLRHLATKFSAIDRTLEEKVPSSGIEPHP